MSEFNWKKSIADMHKNAAHQEKIRNNELNIKLLELSRALRIQEFHDWLTENNVIRSKEQLEKFLAEKRLNRFDILEKILDESLMIQNRIVGTFTDEELENSTTLKYLKEIHNFISDIAEDVKPYYLND